MTEYIVFMLEHVPTCKKYFGVTVHPLETYWECVMESAKSETPTYVARCVRDDPDNFTRMACTSCGDLEEAVAAHNSLVELLKTTDPELGYNVPRGTYDHTEDFTKLALGMQAWKSAEQKAEYRKMLIDRMPELMGMVTCPRDPLVAKDDVLRVFTECWKIFVGCKGWVSQCVAINGNKVSVYEGQGKNRMVVKTKFAIEAMQFVVYQFSGALCAVELGLHSIDDDVVARCGEFSVWLGRQSNQGSMAEILCRNVDNFRTVQTRPDGTVLRTLADLSCEMKNAFIQVLESDPDAYNKVCRIEDQTHADNGESYRERVSRKAMRIKNLKRKIRKNALNRKTSARDIFEELRLQVTKSPA